MQPTVIGPVAIACLALSTTIVFRPVLDAQQAVGSRRYILGGGTPAPVRLRRVGLRPRGDRVQLDTMYSIVSGAVATLTLNARRLNCANEEWVRNLNALVEMADHGAKRATRGRSLPGECP